MCKGCCHVCEGSPCLSRCTKRRLSIHGGPSDEGEDYWDSTLWSDETKVNVFGTDGVQNVWRRKGEECDEERMVPTVKHGGSVFFCGGRGCMNVLGALHWWHEFTDVLKERMVPSLRTRVTGHCFNMTMTQNIRPRPLLHFWGGTEWNWWTEWNWFSGQAYQLTSTQRAPVGGSGRTGWASFPIQHSGSGTAHSPIMKTIQNIRFGRICCRVFIFATLHLSKDCYFLS